MKFKEINSGNIFCKQSKKFDNVRIEIVKSLTFTNKPISH
jgi:hypothetical protein